MATFYIASTGDDTNNGAEATPWRNFLYAIDPNQSADGDTIIVKTGTNVQTVGNASVIDLGNRQILGESGISEENIIDFDGLAISRIYGNLNCVVEGFTIQNIRQTETSKGLFGGSGPFTCLINKINRMVLRDIWIGGHGNSSLPGSGLFNGNTNDRINIENTKISNIRGVSGVGGNYVYFGSDRSDNFILKLKNVTIYNDSAPPVGSANIQEIFSSRTNPGQVVELSADNTVIDLKIDGTINDFFKANGLGTVTFTGSNSCFHNANYSLGGTNVITLDPLYVDPDNGFFDLNPDSPVIGLGRV